MLIPCGEDTTALIKQGEDMEEAEEYAMALMDTAEGETGLRLEVGLGNVHEGLAEWKYGYREALTALDTGRVFHLRGPVQVYRRQTLERMLLDIPEEKRRGYRDTLFTEKMRKGLNRELLETAETFFECDLNLSDTARQMFIHRNTLTYRLDKIRKETGLDLRRFQDAVIFRALTALPEGS